VVSSFPISAKVEEVGMPCTRRCAEGVSSWTVVVPGMRWRNWAAFVLSEVAFTVSMVMSVMLLKMSTSTLWTKMLFRAVLMLSLMAVVGDGSLEPSLLMMSFRSRRERPFLVGRVLVVVEGGAAGAGLAEVVVFFFFFPAT
jgi:hypothetical protein